MYRAVFSLLAICALVHSPASADSTAKARAAFAFTASCPCDLCDCKGQCQCQGGECKCATCRIAVNAQLPSPRFHNKPGTYDVLRELNEQRADRGLEPYIWDADLTWAAAKVSQVRAERLLFEHTANDHSYLPDGVYADAAGCAAYPASYGFMACAMYEPGTHYAGAAYTLGKDNRRYCHLFIRKANVPAVQVPAPTSPIPKITIDNCPTGSWGVKIRAGRR